MSRTNGVKVGLLVGVGVVVLLFAGQVLSFAARWLGRAISGAAILLLAIGLGYIAYQLYSGWVPEDDDNSHEASTHGDDERAFEMDPAAEEEADTTSHADGLSDQELEDELERLRTDTETTETESIHEID